MSNQSAPAYRAWLPVLLLAAAMVLPPGWNLVQYWLHNPLYGFGLFVPVLAVCLGWRRFAHCAPGATSLPASAADKWIWPAKVIIPCVLLAAPVLRIMQIANPDWRMLDWILSGASVAALLALALFAGGTPLLRRCWLPILFLLTAVPWSTSAERSFTEHAMPLTTTAAAELLWSVRVPVVDQGSVLYSGLGPIRVSEDCSGIRGVQLALMAGVFWAGWLGLRRWRGPALVAVGLGLALLINLLRVCTVAALTVRSGAIATADHLHDTAGTIAQFALIAGLPLLGLALRSREESCTGSSHGFSPLHPLAGWVAIAAVVWIGASEVAAEAWFRLHESGSRPSIPYWVVRKPTAIPQAAEQPVAPSIRESLRYSAGSSLSWTDPSGMRWEFFWLDFERGSLSACTHNFHRPDFCLPSNDYTPVREAADLRVGIEGTPLALHHSIYQRDGRPLHLFHTAVSETATDPADLSGWTIAGRLAAARAGRRSHRSQMIHLLLYGDKPATEARRAATAYLPQLLQRVTP